MLEWAAGQHKMRRFATLPLYVISTKPQARGEIFAQNICLAVSEVRRSLDYARDDKPLDCAVNYHFPQQKPAWGIPRAGQFI